MKSQDRNENKPYVAIFGDNETQLVSKAIWSLLSSHELKLANVSSVDELEQIADGAVLILIFIQGVEDENTRLARQLISNPRIVADIVAFTKDADIEERTKILAKGFDAIFNLEFMEYPDFKQVLLNRIERGFVSLENRIQQEEYRRFKASLAASPDAFIVFDENKKIFFVSEHYKKAYPVAGPKLIRGVDVMDAFEMCVDDEYVDREDPRYQAMLDFWQKLEGQVEHTQNDGRIWSIKAKKLPEGQGTIVTTTDITHFRVQEKELKQTSKKLEEALEIEKESNEIQKQFISMISHEFRTPLTIIDGNAQILQRRGESLDPEEVRKKARTMRSAVSRLVSMMEGILSSNMLKTGNLELVIEPVDIKSLVSELCEEHEDLSQKHKISYDVSRLPEEIEADKKILTLVISNLISNAVKFTRDEPKITVKGWAEQGKVHISFEDNGIGIPENEVKRIFERYYRTTTSSGIPGSGIGLNLVKELIELHCGAISVESELNVGTKFVISFPERL